MQTPAVRREPAASDAIASIRARSRNASRTPMPPGTTRVSIDPGASSPIAASARKLSPLLLRTSRPSALTQTSSGGCPAISPAVCSTSQGPVMSSASTPSKATKTIRWVLGEDMATSSTQPPMSVKSYIPRLPPAGPRWHGFRSPGEGSVPPSGSGTFTGPSRRRSHAPDSSSRPVRAHGRSHRRGRRPPPPRRPAARSWSPPFRMERASSRRTASTGTRPYPREGPRPSASTSGPASSTRPTSATPTTPRSAFRRSPPTAHPPASRPTARRWS